MATKPSQFLEWAADGSPTKIYEPPSDLRASGVVAGEAIPFDYFNWLFYTTDRWIKYFEETINYDATSLNLDQTTRLLDGGFWSWNLTTSTLTWDGTMYIAIPSIADADNAIAAGSIVLADGQVAYVAANIPFTTTGNTSSGSPNLTSVAFTNGITIGQTITGTGIPGGTTVVSVAVDSVVMSANASASGSAVNLTFSGIGALTVVAADSATLAPTPNMIILARRHGSAVYVGVNAGQMVMRDGESKRLLRQGFGNVTEFTAGENLAQRDAVYISSTGDTGGRTAGRVYKLDPGTTNGAVRSGFVGFVITAATAGTSVKIVTSGVLGGFSGLTAGAQYYGNTVTPGSYTSTKPTVATEYVILIGIAATATTLLIESQGLNGTIPDGSITTPKLADGSVTTPKILDSAVTTPKLATRSVTAAKLLNNTLPIARNLAVGEWTLRDLGAFGWTSICWSPELKLFVAVGSIGAASNCATSPDGVTWTARTIGGISTGWSSVCWSPDLTLFVAVASSGTNRVSTSPDGITWTLRTAASANDWQAVCWAPSISKFIAVAATGSNLAMTSSNGTTWTSRTMPSTGYIAMCWSPELSLAVATGGNVVATSPDGITWTSRTAANADSGRSVCWSADLGLFAACGQTGSGRVATSPDGITWTARAVTTGTWNCICWSADLGCFIVLSSVGGDGFLLSTDGINYETRPLPLWQQQSGAGIGNIGAWASIVYAPAIGLFVAVSSVGASGDSFFITSFMKSAAKYSFRDILRAAGSHTAGKVAGTYALPLESPLVVSGGGSLYPLAMIYLSAAEYTSLSGLLPRLRLKANWAANDVAPSANLTMGLYPVTRPGTSGGAGVNIYTMGTVVAGSSGAIVFPAGADDLGQQVSAEFPFPADGWYVIGVVNSGTFAASSHVHVNASLQARDL